jgi:adenylylsulfate kinase
MPTSLGPEPQNGLTLWFTGLPCAGKSTLAAQIGQELLARGHQIEVLDADALRHTLCKGLGFSRADREENVLRIGRLCGMLGKYGIISIAAVIAPYRQIREQLRASIPGFVEIYVKAPLGVCVQRDVKGLYAKALKGEITQFTGIDDPYEEPQMPDIVVETATSDVATCCQTIIAWLEQKRLIVSADVSVNGSERFSRASSMI